MAWPETKDHSLKLNGSESEKRGNGLAGAETIGSESVVVRDDQE